MNKHRLFFALWPDDETRTLIVKTFKQAPQSRLKGRIINPANLHLTLHFIGNTTTEMLECLHQAAQTVTGKPFQLNFDRYGHFYRARVFWMGCTHTPEALTNLYQDLGTALSQCDYTAEPRPYAPHLTLMRKLNKPGDLESFQPISWQVNAFVLVESVSTEQGVHYEVIQHYPLSENS